MKTLLTCYSRQELASELSDETSNQITQFILDSFKQKPNLVKMIICSHFETNPELQKTPSRLNSILKEAFSQYQSLTKSASMPSSSVKLNGADSTSQDLESLFESYTYTMSLKDRRTLNRLHSLDPDLKCLIFKSKTVEGNLNSQANMSDFQSMRLKESKLLETIRHYPVTRKIGDLKTEPVADVQQDTDADEHLEDNVYDPIYLLPNMYNLLNYGKRPICHCPAMLDHC